MLENLGGFGWGSIFHRPADQYPPPADSMGGRGDKCHTVGEMSQKNSILRLKTRTFIMSDN